MKRSSNGFSLVEMMTVLVVLAILMTIGFIAYTDYSKTARNGARKKDMNNMAVSLEEFKANAGNYPPPSSGTNFTFMASTLWTQGTFGDSVVANVQNLEKTPLDPKEKIEYTYSLLYTGKEFQIAAAMEDDGSDVLARNVVDSAYAAAAEDTTGIAYVLGTYNGQVAKINVSNINYILALPSIIAADNSTTDVSTVVTNQKLVYHGYNNLPFVFKGTRMNPNGGFSFTPTGSLIALQYNGTDKDLQTYLTTDAGKLALFNAIKNTYTGTSIANLPIMKEVIDINAVSDATLATEAGQKIAENRLKFYIGSAVDPAVIPTVVLGTCIIDSSVLPCTL